MKTRFTGPLGDVMKRHLQLRRSLGYYLRTDEIALDQFDAYIAANFPEFEAVTRPMVTGYLKTTAHLPRVHAAKTTDHHSPVLPVSLSAQAGDLHSGGTPPPRRKVSIPAPYLYRH